MQFFSSQDIIISKGIYDTNVNKAFAYGNYIAGKLYRKNEPLSDLLKVICKKYVGGQNGEST